MVALVIPLVNVVTSPTSLLEKFWAPLINEAAKSEPGRCGMDTFMGAADEIGLPIGPMLLRKTGS